MELVLLTWIFILLTVISVIITKNNRDNKKLLEKLVEHSMCTNLNTHEIKKNTYHINK